MKFVLTTGDTNGNDRQIIVEGIDLKRFIANPIMYYKHDSSLMPIGRWEDIKMEKSKETGQNVITANAVFDLKDSLGKEVARKVNEGFLKAVSIGYFVTEESSIYVNSKPIKLIKKCQIYEASITDLPANQNALKADKFQYASMQDSIKNNQIAREKLPCFEKTKDNLLIAKGSKNDFDKHEIDTWGYFGDFEDEQDTWGAIT